MIKIPVCEEGGKVPFKWWINFIWFAKADPRYNSKYEDEIFEIIAKEYNTIYGDPLEYYIFFETEEDRISFIIKFS